MLVWAAPVETEESFQSGTPEVLFQGSFYFNSPGRTYDVSPDGKRFLMISVSGAGDASSLGDVVIVENWFEELKRLVPIN